MKRSNVIRRKDPRTDRIQHVNRYFSTIFNPFVSSKVLSNELILIDSLNCVGGIFSICSRVLWRLNEILFWQSVGWNQWTKVWEHCSTIRLKCFFLQKRKAMRLRGGEGQKIEDVRLFPKKTMKKFYFHRPIDSNEKQKANFLHLEGQSSIFRTLVELISEGENCEKCFLHWRKGNSKGGFVYKRINEFHHFLKSLPSFVFN